MELTVTLGSEEARRLLDLAWFGVRWHDEPLSTTLDPQPTKDDKRLLESFRAECESAKGGKL